jgi:hypothetical protein
MRQVKYANILVLPILLIFKFVVKTQMLSTFIYFNPVLPVLASLIFILTLLTLCIVIFFQMGISSFVIGQA